MKIVRLLMMGMVLLAPSWGWAVEDFKPLMVLQNAATATGNGTALDVALYNSVAMQITITDTATVTFEGSVNGSTWESLGCLSIADTTSTYTTTASATGTYQCGVAGLAQFRARISAYTGGSVTVSARATTAVISKRGGGGSGAGTLDQAFDGGKTIDGANSLANAFRVGDGVTPMCIYTDATAGPIITPCTDSNVRTRIPANFTWCLYDVEGASCMLTVNPDAPSPNEMYPFTSGYRPRRSVTLTADAFYMQGSCALSTSAALITGGLTEPYITCTDSDSDGFHRSFGMPDSWDGGTITFTVRLTNVNAIPANNYEIDWSAECEANSEVIGTSISTTGEQPTTIDFDNTGSCGTACAQFDLVKVTSAAVTPNGTCAGGNLIRIQGQIDATATTTAQVADVKIIDVTIEYSTSSLSD